MQWQSVAVDGGSGRRPSQQEVETVRRKSDAQSPEIRVGVLAKIFDFFRFSNLFLANANQPTPLASSTVPSLLQDKFAESSKGHFLCCETKLVTSRKKLSRVASKMPAYSDPQNKITSSITLFWPPGGWSLAQLVGWLWLTCFFAAKKWESKNMAEAGNVVHEDDRKLFVGALPQVYFTAGLLSIAFQRHLVRSCIFLSVKLQPLNGAIEIIAFSRRLKYLCLVVDKV